MQLRCQSSDCSSFYSGGYLFLFHRWGHGQIAVISIKALFIQRVASHGEGKLGLQETVFAFNLSRAFLVIFLKLAKVILVSCKSGPLGRSFSFVFFFLFPENSCVRFHQVSVLLGILFDIIRDEFLGWIILVCFGIAMLWIRKNWWLLLAKMKNFGTECIAPTELCDVI